MNCGQRFVTLYRRQGGIKTIPKEKKCKRAKWLSEVVLQIAENKKRSKRQRRKGKIYSCECRVPTKSKEK